MKITHIFTFLILLIVLISIIFLAQFKNPFAVKNSIEIEMPLGENSEGTAPADRINGSQIEIYKDKIVIHINNAIISRYANTSSMIPLINENANGIAIVPDSPAEIHIGDIITFEQDNILVIHRVNKTGYDNEGWYAITKGDNTEQIDGKIRFEHIRYILVGILY